MYTHAQPRMKLAVVKPHAGSAFCLEHPVSRRQSRKFSSHSYRKCIFRNANEGQLTDVRDSNNLTALNGAEAITMHVFLQARHPYSGSVVLTIHEF